MNKELKEYLMKRNPDNGPIESSWMEKAAGTALFLGLSGIGFGWVGGWRATIDRDAPNEKGLLAVQPLFHTLIIWSSWCLLIFGFLLYVVDRVRQRSWRQQVASRLRNLSGLDLLELILALIAILGLVPSLLIDYHALGLRRGLSKAFTENAEITGLLIFLVSGILLFIMDAVRYGWRKELREGFALAALGNMPRGNPLTALIFWGIRELTPLPKKTLGTSGAAQAGAKAFEENPYLNRAANEPAPLSKTNGAGQCH